MISILTSETFSYVSLEVSCVFVNSLLVFDRQPTLQLMYTIHICWDQPYLYDNSFLFIGMFWRSPVNNIQATILCEPSLHQYNYTLGL